ncbi:MAG TPA: xanthine dehydrogenase family protein subunit M [Candidatus Acidoferrales bacterium]|nr:xanthine dehydrogenase family protein subunit M [Candidatus Acidoferrales bacterium]
MYPAPFDYFQPRTLEEAVELLQTWGESARVLAGGQSLIPLMKLRLARPRCVIDLNCVPGLSYIREEDGWIRVGALTRHAEIEASPLIRERAPIAWQAMRRLGDLQVRNLGTIGGAVVEADPAGDWGPVVLALDARIRCASAKGTREIEAKDFFTFAYTTALEPEEVVTEIALRKPAAPQRGAYLKLERVAGDFAVASVALQLDLDEKGACREVGIGLGGAHDRPFKPSTVESYLRGRTLASETVDRAAEQIQEVASPIGDLRGSADYKREVLKVLFRRAARAALAERV